MAEDVWDEHAAWWQEEFTEGADVEYTEQIIPMVMRHLPLRGRVLDIGAGEGQVGRAAATAGLRVTSIDGSWQQVVVGHERGGSAWVRGNALALPVRSGTFDAAIACLVIEHIADLAALAAEVARVLKPGGAFLVLMNHPLLQTPGSGWIDDHILEEQYWRVGPYLPEAETVEEVGKDVFITFFHRPLGTYLNTFRDASLVLDRFEEPAPPAGFLAQAPEYTEASTIPRLLLLRFVRGGGLDGR